MADEDKFWYELIDTATKARVGTKEFLTKHEANRRNHDIEKKYGSKRHEWRRCDDMPNPPTYHMPPTLFDK